MKNLLKLCLLIHTFQISVSLPDPPHNNESFPGVVNQTVLNETNPDMDFIDFKESPHFGQLHSLENLSMWAVVEELTVALLKARLDLIEEEASLIKSLLTDYKETSGKALEHAHAGSNLTLEERGRIIGSSFVLGHRMTSRFCGVTKKLRQLLKSPEYTTIEEAMDSVLRLKPPPKATPIPENGFENMTENSTEFEPVPHYGIGNGTQNQSEIPPIEPEPSMFIKLGPNNHESEPMYIAVPFDWPDWPDMYMSMTSFITLQEVNGIPPEKLINGLTLDTDWGGHLTALHCVEIGMFALRRERYYMAVDWLEVALELATIENSAGNETIPLDLVLSLFQLAVQEHNRMWEELAYPKPWNLHRSNWELFVEPLTEYTFRQKVPLSNFRQISYFEHRGIEGPDNWSPAQHIDVCIGFTRQTPKMQINLKCYYEKTRHPYLYINPIKVEKLAENPPVFQFYEMLGNDTMEHIKWLASPRLRLSSLVGVSVDDWDEITHSRTSVGCGMDQTEIPKAYKLAEMVSGLKVIDASENTQVVEYTYGRHYMWHPDTYDDEEESQELVAMHGDRVATMLYYIEIPKLGGLTSFCNAGIGGHHVRGSAVLWFNLYRNGTSRKDVFHGACPVIHGQKVAANHWIRYLDNWNHYKCSTNQFE